MLRIFIAFTVFFLSITQLFATHMAGAELAYFNQGGGKYLLVAKIYRLCDGIPLNNPTGTVFVTNNAYNSCGSNNITFTRTAIQDVSFLCKSTSKCNPANTWTTGQGFEMHTFTATLDLAASPYAGYLSTSGCDVVTFTIAQCCRDINVTTFKSDNFIATATLYVGNLNNLSNKTNSSPTFVDLPVINYCCNIPITQFFEAKDSINKDILKYKLVNALNGINSPVNYYSPWSGEYPLTAYCPGGGIKCTPKPYKNIPEGIYLDSNTGEFIFTPIQCSEIGPVCVEVSEYRKSGNNLILVGNTRRDIIFKTIDCGQNKAPIIKSNNEYVLCTGDSSDIVIETLDTFKNNQGNLDTIDFKYKSDITKGTFNFDKNGRQPKLTLSWRPQSNDVRIEPYYIKITTIDQNCPFPGTSSKLIKLRVTHGNVNVATKAEIGKCNTVNMSFTSSKSLTKSKMTWILTDSNKSDTIFNTSSNSFTTPKLKKGKYYIFGKLESIDLCNSINTFDSVTIKKDLPTLFLGNDTLGCYKQNLHLKPQIANFTPPVKYKWTLNKIVLSDTSSHLDLQFQNKKDTVFLRIDDADGCNVTDQIEITGQKLPITYWKTNGLGTYCAGNKDLDLDPYYYAPEVKNVSITATDKDIVKQKNNKWVIEFPTANNCTYSPDGKELPLYISGMDSAGCFTLDTATILIHCNPEYQLISRYICQSAANRYPLENLSNSYYQKDGYNYEWKLLNFPLGIDPQKKLVNNSNLNKNWDFFTGNYPDEDEYGIYELSSCKVHANSGCKTCETSKITLSGTPVFTFNSPGFCSKNTKIDLWPLITQNNKKYTDSLANISIISLNNDTNKTTWGNANVQQSRWFLTGSKVGIWKFLIVAKNDSCSTTDSFSIEINHSPISKFSSNPKDTATIDNPKFAMVNNSSIPDNTNLTFIWDPGTGILTDRTTTTNPTFYYAATPSNYTILLVATSENNCSDTSYQKVVLVEKNTKFIELENNEMRINNQFQLLNFDFKAIKTHVHSVSGQLISTSRNNEKIAVPNGTYLFTIEVIGLDGKTYFARGKRSIIN